MKQNQPRKGESGKQSYTIHDYGHDRTVHSLGRGSAQARRQHKKQRSVLVVMVLLVVISIAAWQFIPQLPWGPETETTTSKPSQSETTTTAGSTTTAVTESSTASTTPATTSTASTAATISPAERQALLKAAADEITSTLEKAKGRFGVYYKNLATGETWQYKAEQPFVAASSIKLGINTYLYTKIASGEISPDKVLSYDNRAYPTGDFEAGTGIIQYEANGTQHTVRDTSGLSIRKSDNCGTNMVIRLLGGIDAINPYLNQISGVVDYRKKVSYTTYAGQAASGKHRSCAIDLGSQAVNLYQLWEKTPDVYQPLIDDLCATEFDFGIQKGVPAGVHVAHKIGTNGTYSAENDVGIVFADEPYVLCVMTEMASAYEAHQIQADVSKTLYEYVDGLQK